MVRQLKTALMRHIAVLSAMSALFALSMMPFAVAAEPLLRTEQQYRLAAWHFYQDDYYQALLQLALAPENSAKASLLQAGLLLQLDMPAATASLLQRLLDDHTLSGQLPVQLRNVALLQFARFQYEQQHNQQARYYLQQLSLPLNELAGEAELLTQMLRWPELSPVDSQVFSRLAGQSQLPYVVINQILTLRQQQQPLPALQLLTKLSQQLQVNAEPGFWLALFHFRAASPLLSDSTERQALADYLQLLKAGLLVDQLQWANAQQVLSEFASNSVLTLSAMTLYRDVLSENRQIPSLLAVLQQLIVRFPYASAGWLAAHQLGEQFERALAPQDALTAYRWADHYYQQQLTDNTAYAVPLSAAQLAKPDGLSAWQHYQLRQQSQLFQLRRQLAALQQLQQLQQQRQARMANLAEVVATKLAQQHYLLASALPELGTKQHALQQQVKQLHIIMRKAADEPMAQLLWQGEAEQHFAQLQQLLVRAEGRVASLTAAGRDVSQVKQRLGRLRGILQWHYQQSAADRRWQFSQQQQQLTATLSTINAALKRLATLDGKTERLLAQQQQLELTAARENQFSADLAAQQQQLVAELNRGLQQLRLSEREQLLALQKLNTQAIARVMEQLLLTSQEGQ
ncbi:hypothetical protein VT06_10330 [Arsukibacterium sp. MJ3]|uniref:hypothetical protein n=1 Tax=Arsukibacterium sp. MJ3 TaxID=1632859 RepID=UPI0006273FAD|nr:hypothetical protein [Arsukibacterium sp. MJ3]KKO48687.1 hypothetical protein VT06_10330 [Arsukibacterium sp. MJ3]